MRVHREGPRRRDKAPLLSMTREQHRERHQMLHECFDELLADFIDHNRENMPSSTPIVELMNWSARQTIEPDERG